jgi:hypothetical protein
VHSRNRHLQAIMEVQHPISEGTYHSLRETGSEKQHPSLPSAFLDQPRLRYYCSKKARIRYTLGLWRLLNIETQRETILDAASPGFGGVAVAMQFWGPFSANMVNMIRLVRFARYKAVPFQQVLPKMVPCCLLCLCASKASA